MGRLNIEYVSINDIRVYANNSKRHPAEQIEQIKKSIQDFGFNDPLAVWNGEIVEGHGRYIAAEELGIDTVPVIRLDGLSDQQRKAYALVHNKLTMNSGFDFDLLQLELDSLDFDMTDFGFDIGDEEITKEPKEINLIDNWEIIIECQDEEEQHKIYNELSEKGYSCRLSTL